MKKMKFAQLITALFVVFLTACNAQQAPNSNKETATTIAAASLDGRTFFIESFGPDGAKSGEEFVYFKDGTIEGSECNKYGYNKPAYSCEKSGEKSNFKATMISDKEGKLTWDATISGSEMSGTSLWTKDGQSPMTITYKGKEVKK
jgi:hypothetical protein